MLDDGNKWTRGLCCSMAVALHQQTGFPIWAILSYVPDDAPSSCPCEGLCPSCSDKDYAELDHAFVIAPDGQALDADGYGVVAEMGETGKVWEAGIGIDKHPQTGRKGQWWDARLEQISVERLCQIREASNDVLCPDLLMEAKKWIDENRILKAEE